jgi:hypothetical protein
MDHLSDYEFCRDDSHARSFWTDLRNIILRVVAISEFRSYYRTRRKFIGKPLLQTSISY